jgi:heptosyltransferase III
MNQQLISLELLHKSHKILFVTHLAIGDFTYMQNCLHAFSQAYPHIEIHIWIDEVRKTRCFWRWKFLKKYALYDWLSNCSFIKKIYTETYAPSVAAQMLKHAQNEHYPLVVSLATLRSGAYARLAHSMSTSGFVVGMSSPISIMNIADRMAYARLNATLHLESQGALHISSVYALWFERLFGISIPQKNLFPFVTIPNKWMAAAKLRFLKWGIDKKSKPFGFVVFINPYAKTHKRSWPLANVVETIRQIKHDDVWHDVSFIVNVPPEHHAATQKFFQKHSVTDTFLFSADYNFFQLPAMMSICDLIISVETSTMHLANAVHVPVIALMRTKNPEWAPIDTQNSTVITTKNRQEWVKDIPVDAVIKAFDTKTRIF